MVDSSRSRSPWDDRDPRDGRDGRNSFDSRDARSDWGDTPSRRSYRRPEPGLEQRLDQWMTAGRQLVDGVAGSRPGSRSSPRLRPGDLGRWVENKIDWLLEDDEGWREPWQERSATPSPARSGRRQPLEAISRRSAPLLPPQPAVVQPPQTQNQAQDWPDDASFSVSRWRREPVAGGPLAPPEPPSQPSAAAARAVPRSSRRRLA